MYYVHSIGNIINNVIITLYGGKWLLNVHGDHIVRNINVKSLYHILETNEILNANNNF